MSETRVNAKALECDFTAVRQRAWGQTAAPTALLSLTDQRTRAPHLAIRVTAHADRELRGWTQRDVFRMRDLIGYARAAGRPAPLVLVAKDLQPGTPAVVLGAELALVEAVRQIADALARRSADAEAEYLWWLAENADVISA